MVKKDLEFENKVKLSFLKVKENISEIKKEINSLKQSINSQKEEFSSINVKIQDLTLKVEKITQKQPPLKDLSIGNDGVLTTNKQQQTNTNTTNKQQKPTLSTIKTIVEPLKKDLESTFLSLTNLEFALFTTIYQLEEELNHPITYQELAERFHISQSFVRGMIRELITKKAPLIKRQDRTRKVSLSIPKSFRDLNLLSKLIKFREFDADQTTLFKY